MELRGSYTLLSRHPAYPLAVTIVALALNLLLRELCLLLELPFFFDSIGTAVAAAVGGLLPGLITGILTNGLQEVFRGFTGEYYPWALCSASTAVIVWAFVRTKRFSTVKDAVYGSILVTVSNSLIGAIIAAYLYSGITGVPIDYIVSGLMLTGKSTFLSALLARIPSNLIDKTITVFIAFYVYRYLRTLRTEKEYNG
jgi:energy-coupling factor transport system substrate-specific component